MYYLIKWHRGTPTVPPVGAVNVPAENPKIQKIHIFEDFWGHFFLINHIGFSLKYVIPKSSTDFFSSKTKSFSIFSFFMFLSYFIPNLWKFHCATPSTPRAKPKRYFFNTNQQIQTTNFLRIHLRALAESWYRDFARNVKKKRRFGLARGVEGVAQWNFQRLGMKYN